jgi:single-stranded-DNA-specific exonuclease
VAGKFDPPPIVRRVLSARGIRGEDEIDGYFDPSLARLAASSSLPGITEAAGAIFGCCGEIVVFGDYDCDGVCASAILVKCLRSLGRQVRAFLPERLSEGYGMSDASVERMLKLHPGVELVVTVDNGVNSVRQIAMLKARGIKVVVTDHHLPGRELPPADVLVNPCVRPGGSMSPVCGAAVAFMLAGALVEIARARCEYSGGPLAGSMIVLAGLATVTDAMPLVGQNRIFVAQASRLFHTCAPLGLRRLYEAAAKSPGQVTYRDFGFTLGPRINASGRMASGVDALELLLTEDETCAGECVAVVDRRNGERKDVEQQMLEEAMSKVVPGAPSQVIEVAAVHPGAVGVAGIVASRVMERIASDAGLSGGLGAVPVCVVVDGRGSARAPAGFNIRDALERCSDALEHFGGHAAAAGFSVKDGRIGDFRSMLAGCCARTACAAAHRQPASGRVEVWLDGGEISLDLARWVQRMEPFGEGNPEPVFGIRGVRLSQVRSTGAAMRHLQFCVDTPSPLRSIWWNRGDREKDLRENAGGFFDIVFNLTVSHYGSEHVQLKIIDVTASADAGTSAIAQSKA